MNEPENDEFFLRDDLNPGGRPPGGGSSWGQGTDDSGPDDDVWHHWNWSWVGEREDTSSGTDWGWWYRDDRGGAPFLRVSEQGLLRTHGGKLLIGSISCAVPALLGYFCEYPERDPEDEDFQASRLDHRACVLCELDDPDRAFRLHRSLDIPDADDPLYENLRFACDASFRPGEFRFRVRWQSGHADYDTLNRMRFIVYGVDLGWQQIPVSDWCDAAVVRINERCEPYVNNIRGSIAGNLKFLKQESK